MSTDDEPEKLDPRLLTVLEELGPKRAARAIYLAMLFRGMDPNPEIDALFESDPGHRWFMYCLTAVARQPADAVQVVLDHRAKILAARADDPLAQDKDHADWRDQEVVNVEVLRGDAGN